MSIIKKEIWIKSHHFLPHCHELRSDDTHADDTHAMLQSRETIPFFVVNVCPRLSVNNDKNHKDGIASSFSLLFTKSKSGIKKRSLCKLGRSFSGHFNHHRPMWVLWDPGGY